MEEKDYEKIEQEIKKIRYNLENNKNINMNQRLGLLNILRYDLSQIEDRDKVVKVKYNTNTKRLEYSESIQVGIAISMNINQAIKEESNLEEQQKLYKVMQETYYYLARYLFEYFLPAMEFGIPPEKQFIAPRTMVLSPIAREMSKFYYREDRPIMTLSMPQGTGKEQPLSSKILTPTGWITMGDVKIGTKVIGADGKPCNVTGVYPKGIKDVYRVTFKDNSYVDCGLEHLWEVQTREDRIKKKIARIVNTKQMLNDFRIKQGNNWYNNYSIRLVKPIEFTNSLTQTDIHPYVLGTLIANGSLNGGISFSTNSKEIVEKMKKYIYKEDIVTNQANKYVFGIKSKEDKRNNKGYYIGSKTKAKLKELNLYGKKSENKFIPKKYLYTDVKNRIELLRGLMDNDGTVNNKKQNGTSQYTTVSKQLCEDFLELVRSLGGKASYSKKETYYKKNGVKIKCKDVYNIYFTLNINPYSITEKAKYYKTPTYCRSKYIVNIEKVRQEECQCIMIDHPEHLYVTDGYTLTHNTEVSKRFLAWSLGNNPDSPSMFVSYSASIAKDKRICRNRFTFT